MRPLIAILMLIAANPALAQPKSDNAESKMALTIHPAGGKADHGFAIVRETRKLPLNRGDNVVKFADVPAAIDPSSVTIVSLTSPDNTRVIEQSFQHDAVSPDKLLEKYLGKNIIINRKQEPLPGDRARMPESIEARLLAFTPDQFVLQTNNKQLPVQIIPRNLDVGEIKLFDLPGGLTTRPTLVWKLQTQKQGDHDVCVTYKTAGISWRADYQLTLARDEKSAELSAWITIANQSGASFKEARIKLVDDEKRSHALESQVTLENGENKQVGLFAPRVNLKTSKAFYFAPVSGIEGRIDSPRNQKADLNEIRNRAVAVMYEIESAGVVLPGGRVRIDHDDADDAPELVGEHLIDHTGKDERLLVRGGRAVEIAGERIQTAFENNIEGRFITERFSITLRNQGKQAARVLVEEKMLRTADWQFTSDEKFEKQGNDRIRFWMDVPAGGEKTTAHTIKHTW